MPSGLSHLYYAVIDRQPTALSLNSSVCLPILEHLEANLKGFVVKGVIVVPAALDVPIPADIGVGGIAIRQVPSNSVGPVLVSLVHELRSRCDAFRGGDIQVLDILLAASTGPGNSENG